jgi:hypothetical protein
MRENRDFLTGTAKSPHSREVLTAHVIDILADCRCMVLQLAEIAEIAVHVDCMDGVPEIGRFVTGHVHVLTRWIDEKVANHK